MHTERSTVVEVIPSEPWPHSCVICSNPRYKEIGETIERYGLPAENYGYLLHEVQDDGKTDWRPHSYGFDLDEFAAHG